MYYVHMLEMNADSHPLKQSRRKGTRLARQPLTQMHLGGPPAFPTLRPLSPEMPVTTLYWLPFTPPQWTPITPPVTTGLREYDLPRVDCKGVNVASAFAND
jgi:hypothetical protein